MGTQNPMPRVESVSRSMYDKKLFIFINERRVVTMNYNKKGKAMSKFNENKTKHTVQHCTNFLPFFFKGITPPFPFPIKTNICIDFRLTDTIKYTDIFN